MNVKQLYNNINEININSYLSLCGVKNVESYIRGRTVESTTHYDNIDKYCKSMEVVLNSTDRFYLLVDS